LLRPPRWSSVRLRSVRLATGNPIRVLEFDRMHPAIPRLIDLQAVDHHIAAVRAEMDSFPKRILEADHKLSGAKAAVAAAKDATATSVAERKKLEFEVQQWKDRARKYRDQSGAVKTNEAFKALQHEITNAEAEVAKAEDRQLEVMMAGEEAERRVRNAEANLREDEQAINAERKRIQSLNTDKKKELDAALAERERVIAPVPQEMRDLYERIAKRHHGTALAQARDEQCRGCGMRVLPHILQMLRDDANEEVYRCESCGLILYTLEPIPAPNSAAGSGSVSSASTSS
jgi:predicted  nucleic acid-binding Zn-ribbon protein